MTAPKILIVDDEPFNIDYLEQELEGLECDILTASNGQEALEKVRSASPDLILLDIMMSIMDGFEVLTRLKANSATRDIPVIVISADNNLQSVVKGIQLGAEDYLPKPFEPTLLHARLASSLEKKHLRDLQQIYLKSLERELDIGRKIQMGFLPSSLPIIPGWEIAAYFQAAHEVAGDFYDSFQLPDGNLLCIVGDVCDKGVGAALFMTLFRSLVRATATSDLSSSRLDMAGVPPADRLRHVISFTNQYIVDIHGDANMFATIFISILNPRDGSLDYINCGHEQALLLRNNHITPLPPTSPAVGIIPDADFTVQKVTLEKNDLLLACTDGIPDALDGQSNAFGNDRFFNILTQNETTPSVLLKNIEEQVRLFIGPARQFDDITLLALKRLG